MCGEKITVPTILDWGRQAIIKQSKCEVLGMTLSIVMRWKTERPIQDSQQTGIGEK